MTRFDEMTRALQTYRGRYTQAAVRALLERVAGVTAASLVSPEQFDAVISASRKSPEENGLRLERANDDDDSGEVSAGATLDSIAADAWSRFNRKRAP